MPILGVIDRGVVELNAHFATPGFHFLGYKIRAVVGDDTVGDTVTVYNLRYEVYYWSGFGRFNWFGFYPFGELVHHDQ